MFCISKLFDDDDGFAHGSCLGNRGGREQNITRMASRTQGCGDECGLPMMVVSLRVQFGSQSGVCAALGVYFAFGICELTFCIWVCAIFRLGERRQTGQWVLSQNFVLMVWSIRMRVSARLQLIFHSYFKNTENGTYDRKNF